jgi:hypothetical protein
MNSKTLIKMGRVPLPSRKQILLNEKKEEVKKLLKKLEKKYLKEKSPNRDKKYK